MDLELSITGFEAGEVDLILSDFGEEQPDPADRLAAIRDDQPAVTQPGMLWFLGKHRLSCGDARDRAQFERLMGGEKAEMVFTDPPYNVKIDGNVMGRGRIRHREFAMASGEMDEAAFRSFLTNVLGNLAAVSLDGSIHYVCMDWRHMGELGEAGRTVYSALKNVCVWAKTNAGQGSFYRSQHELVFVFKHGEAEHLNTFGLGASGRNRSNVWTYAGINSFRAGRLQELALHPTVKPVALVADCMRDCSSRGGIVLDGFAGSGTTIIAAEKVGRRGYGLEIDPLYVDAAVRRWQVMTGKDAIDAATGATFDEHCTRGCAALPDPQPSASGPPTQIPEG